MRKRIWGWFFFDWASQPYNTLLLTFIFAPYVKELIGDGAAAQSAWGFGIGAAGVCIAVLAPVLGAISDVSGQRLRWIWFFSALYVVGAAMLWMAAPGHFNLNLTLFFFAIGLIGMEFATIFTNAMLPDLGTREEIGRISGNGWAFGYVGGLIALIIMLTLLAENANTGKTLIGIDPIFGLDAETREGTRAVGPLTAIWYVIFMVPFFAFVKEDKRRKAPKGAVAAALRNLGTTLKSLPKTPSLFAYLGSSMLYRDALNGMYFFGGIYASGVLGWSVTHIGIFGIISIISGALFAWLGGYADAIWGPKAVIRVCILILTLVAIVTVTISPTHVLWFTVPEGSTLPDITFFVIGAAIGAAGGVLQSASRTMMVRQARPDRMTEAFGLYALAGKATSFIAPTLIGIVTVISGSQQIGITPLVFLFLLGWVLLAWVKPDGDTLT
ncbi:MFS transporter [Pseudooceanicola spongiae]|uniref:MFS transporter n=1 Tax=Pseudooceanicola spongiae TaxID=2613965 RepID=A0A7L9WPK4_9RHOB|nr:MFS transporter [Pseudooceanicola spongiae]QOL81863.1 MFS transporter [Pseudooceanicola spongiae]